LTYCRGQDRSRNDEEKIGRLYLKNANDKIISL
jgi:hypothetical protein